MTPIRHLIVCFFSTLALSGVGCQSSLAPADAIAPHAPQGQDSDSPRTRTDAVATPPAPAALALPAASIEGTIELAKALRARAEPNDTVYVMAREAASQKMVAVTRLFVPVKQDLWPLHFILQDDRLLRDMPVTLSVRIDKDGDATTKNPGDLVGSLAHEISAPNPNARIVVDQTL